MNLNLLVYIDNENRPGHSFGNIIKYLAQNEKQNNKPTWYIHTT